MKQLLRIIFFVCVVTLVNAQHYSRVYSGNNLALGGEPTSLVTEGDTLVAVSLTQGNFRQIIFRSFTRAGLVLDSNVVEGDTGIFTIAIRKNSIEQSRNNYYSLHDYFYNNGSSEARIFYLNSKLDTIKTVVFNPMNANEANSFDVLVEDTAITVLGHYALPNQKLDLFLARYDTTLNLKWHTTIADFRPNVNGNVNGYYPYRIRRMGNNYYIAGRCLYPNQFVEGFLVKTDLQGNKIWDKRYQYNNTNSMYSDFATIHQDTLFVPGRFTGQVVGTTPFTKHHFMLQDTAGNTLKDSVYPDEEALFLLEATQLLDNRIYMVGSFYQGGSKGVVWQMDKNLNTLWRRVYYYGDWEDESWLYSINQWSDGGFVAVGSYFDRYLNTSGRSQFLWLLSTDSTGCLGPGNCGSDISVVEWALPGQGIKIYPNPATDYINVELSLPGLQNTTATATLYNLAGQEVLWQEVQFVNGKARLDLTAQVSSALGGEGWSGLLQLKTPTHVFVEKIMINQ
jgi:hypothetical protein